VSLLRTPEYRASTELLVEPFQRIEEASLDDLGSGTTGAETIRRLITAADVRSAVATRVGLPPDDPRLSALEVSTIPGTRILTLTVTGTDPLLVANISITYAEAFLDVRRERVLREVTAARSALDDQISELERVIVTIDQDLERRRSSAQAVGALQLERDVQFSRLSRLLQQRAELVEDATELSSGGQVLRPAGVPRQPFRPQPVRDSLLALLVGLAGGVGLALLRDQFDDRVRDELDVRRATGMRPLLGRIPTYRPRDGVALRGAISVVDPGSIAAESYRELSTNLRFLLGTAASGRAVSVMVVSASADDGKTATSVNLAVAAARAGQRVILVDADLRRPSVNAFLGLGRLRGLTDATIAGLPMEEMLVAVGVDRLRLLPAGSIPPNPADFLAGPGMSRAHLELTELADLIVYDTPAALAVPDALEVGRLVDGALVVLQHEKSTRREIVAAVERLEQVGVPVFGTVMNAIRTGSDTYYYYYSYYHNSGYFEAEDGSNGAGGARLSGNAAGRNGNGS
jgi:capsular exopolysaccharide synthesis family protein